MISKKNVKKSAKHSYISIGITGCLLLGVSFTQQQNHAPEVKIISPKANSAYPANTQVRYEISVSDKEDGDSKFQEIPVNEIFLQVRYFSDAAKAATALQAGTKNDPPGLVTIESSNCLNCHAFNARLIGPSFYDISKRYPYSKANTDTLGRRIREGSTGVWGNIKMPTHPELTKAQTDQIVKWILQNAADPAVSYYTGTEGSFRLTEPAGKAAGKGNKGAKGAFVLTAGYTDHGMKDKPGLNLRGQDAVLIREQ